jgi:hypothetical protein
MGFLLGKGAYLKDGWNFIDFIVVLSSFTGLIASTAKVSALRAIRILRPLRSIN